MKNNLFLKLWILFKIETTNSYVRNCHICRKSFLEIMKLTNKWLMELFLQADDPNYFSCFKFMCHNHHNQLCLMILRHKIHIIRIFIYITMKRNHFWIRVSTFTYVFTRYFLNFRTTRGPQIVRFLRTQGIVLLKKS